MNLLPQPVPARLGFLPEGDAGVRVTLKQMAALVRQFKTNAQIYTLARQITANLPPQNAPGAASQYITALQHWVRDRIRYVYDAHEVESIQWPTYTVSVGTGDCDDKAVLLDSLLASVGYPVMFFAIGLDGAPYSHVLAGVKVGTRQIPLETILPKTEPGWLPPNAAPVLPWNV